MKTGRPKHVAQNELTLSLIEKYSENFKDEHNNLVIPNRTSVVFKIISAELLEISGISRSFEAVYLYCARYTKEVINQLGLNLNPVTPSET